MEIALVLFLIVLACLFAMSGIAGMRHRGHRQLALAPGLALALALGACTEGYPPVQREPVEPQLMNTGQLVKALNTMGQRAAGRRTWAYRLMDDCVLAVSTNSPGVRDGALHPLRGARFNVGYDKALSAYEVQILPQGDERAEPRLLLKAGDWADAVFANSVLWHLQQNCA